MVAGGTGSGARGPGEARAQHSAGAEAARKRCRPTPGRGARMGTGTQCVTNPTPRDPLGWRPLEDNSTQRCVYNADGLREAAGLGHTAS